MSADYDYAPPPRLQPATKLALAVIAGLLLVAVVAVIVIVANRPGGTSKAAERAQTHKPGRPSEDEEPAPLSSTPLISEQSSRVATILLLWALGIALVLVYLVLVAFAGAWMARDAAARGLEPGAWAGAFLLAQMIALLGLAVPANPADALLLLPAAWLALAVYLLSRRRGRLAHCDSCGQKYLHYRPCPHCGGGGKGAPLPDWISPPPQRG